MQKFLFRLTIGLAALTFGIGVTAFLFFREPLPVIDFPKFPSGCADETDAEILNPKKIDWKWGFFPSFQESPLENQIYEADEAYRLLWIPTFDEPTVIRVWRSGEKYYITTKRLHRNQENLEVGKLTVNQTRSLTAEEWNNFTDLVNHGCFWKAPSSIQEIVINDGAWWLFEGSSNEEYHFVERTFPSEYMKEIYRYLFKLSKMDIKFEEYF